MMNSNRNFCLWLIAVLLGAASWLTAVEFIPPAEGPVAFRRDKIPLEVEEIAALSEDLNVLASGLPGKTAEELHGAAQMLAISLALNPSNTNARKTLKDYQKNTRDPMTDADQLERSRAKVWQMAGWLEMPDAGRHGQALANCLKDVIVISDPKHPKSAPIIAAGANGEWMDWVPELSSYQKSATPTEQVASTRPEPKPEPKPTTPSGPLLKHAQIDTVLWKNAGTAFLPKWIYAPATLQMTGAVIQPDIAEPKPYPITIGGTEGLTIFGKTNQLIGQLITQQFKNIPANLKIDIHCEEILQSAASGKKQSITAAAAVLASSAVTGIEPEAIVIGTVDETGAFKLPQRFWDQIRSLVGKGTGKRLILPTEAASFMPALLAMENPAFFMEYEVLLAADFKQLLILTAKSPDAAIALSLAKFQEIRAKSNGQELRQYFVNPYVRKRLAEMSQDALYHLSAKMLLLQAEGKRPTLLPRKVLASELRRAIEPMSSICENPIEETILSSMSKVGDILDLCRSSVDELERYVDKSDRLLLDETRDLVKCLRSFDKALRARPDLYYPGRENAREVLIKLVVQWNQLTAQLAGDTGDSPAL